MTNLIATIIVSTVTNWTDISTTYPKIPETEMGGITTLVYTPIVTHQRGDVSQQTIALINWKGKKIKAVLEESTIKTINRDIDTNTGMQLSW